MATMFGQGATYDAIEGRFRRYRKIADELRSEAHARGVDVSRAGAVPRTPRGPRSRVSKSTPSSSSSKRYTKLDFDKEDVPDSPSKGKGKPITTAAATEMSNVISLDDGTPGLPISNSEAAAQGVKTEAGTRFLPLTSPFPPTFPPVKREKRESIDLGVESVAGFPVKVKTEPGMSAICDDEDSDGNA